MRRRPMLVAGTTALVSAALLAPQVAQSAPGNDPVAQREAVRAAAAANAAQIDTSKASVAEIDAALTTLQANVTTQQAALDRANDALAQAEDDIASADAAITKLSGEISVLQAEMTRRAIQAYVQPTGDDLLTVLESKDFTTATEQTFFVELRSQNDADLEERLEGAQVDRDHEKDKADEARTRAKKTRDELSGKVAALEEARAQQLAVFNQAQATLNAQIAYSVQLSTTDQKLSAQIAEQQAALAARLAQEQAAMQAQAEAQAQAQAQAEANINRPTPGGGGNGGGTTPTTRPTTTTPQTTRPGATPTTRPNTPTTRPTTTAPVTTTTAPYVPPVVTPPVSPGISLCTVSGIRVNCAISGPLQRMISAAASGGVTLTGSGYRDINVQIQLRKEHCGTSYYAIYQMPSSQCSPPTAKPGSSQHEIGLAIDFNSCSSRSTACYRWLAANAASFGFYNLPSEPWHWSTTGK